MDIFAISFAGGYFYGTEDISTPSKITILGHFLLIIVIYVMSRVDFEFEPSKYFFFKNTVFDLYPMERSKFENLLWSLHPPYVHNYYRIGYI